MNLLLALEDGTIFPGRHFAGPVEGGGEVIFNTGMTGYQEILTDPSYTGQMVTMTYPLVGNYGVNPGDVESSQIHVAGFIVKEVCKRPSNWCSSMSLPDYLERAGVIGVEGVDTRALTRHLRVHGAMRGYFAPAVLGTEAIVAKARALPSMQGLNLADGVSAPRAYRWNGSEPEFIRLGQDEPFAGTGPRLAVYDFGITWDILRLLAGLGFDILGLPSTTPAAMVRDLGAECVFLSNGPGDPAAVTSAVAAARDLTRDLPMAGICLGHQILGLALGAATFKLNFGHHGCNHPVMDMETGKIEISSQNHGFCVDITGVPHLKMTHKNLNDQTLEGFVHREKPIMAIQYHPEAAPGPRDSRYFFPHFREMVKTATGR